MERAGLLIKNLDTGEIRNVLQDDPNFFDRPADPKDLARTEAMAWDGWRQELRHNNEALWKAAETGSTDRMQDLLAATAIISEDMGGSIIADDTATRTAGGSVPSTAPAASTGSVVGSPGSSMIDTSKN